ncbi:bifunctional nitrate reductase/sulfite reductase flavoprotein subunit alpha [Pseudomonas typographi]|uniref:bifunctional nitrate reductase/sulfite reductase flavoprotein subunit alpha n=1 Tax=Pseudomonas typographi TaxID=2715964 RepID=UPI001685CC0E|nr:bifunctional nitrate reductase/sulfite reductase flavoprotein subunit alpha [Pseudomonas typographi]MBD1587879.1 molybdopterin-dependent oxidoreductase [Pseudomonas typographi]
MNVRSVCPYCGVGCGIVMSVEGNRVTRVTGDKAHPSNFGRLCTKGQTSHLPLADAGRLCDAWLRHERSHDPVRVPLQSAIQAAAERLRAIIERDGPDAVALYVSGQMSLEAQYLANKLAKGFIGTQHIESNSRLCMASAGTGYKQSLGADGPPGSYEDFDQADLFFVSGANMADCHPILYLRMLDRIKAGARLIVVDPRRTATAEKADLFLQIKPGTDLALLNGLLHLLYCQGRIDEAFIAQHCEGWEAMPGFLADYSPERVAAITGLAEPAIHQAADWIGLAPNWMSCWTMGLNQSTHGTWNTNALCNLHLATGAICRPGSGPFSLTGQPNAMGGREMGYMGPGLPGQRSALVAQDRQFIERLWGLPEGRLRSEGGQGTVAMYQAMAAGTIKACWIICTNPVASMPNRQAVIEGLRRAELVIAQDAFLDTDTNRYADILLPGALWAEGDGVMVNSERNLTLAAKAVEPPGQSLPDWQLIAQLACAMGYAEAFNYDSAEQVFDEIRQCYNPATGYDLRGASYARLRQAPLQWPCPRDDGPGRNPVRYLNDGVSQVIRLLPGGERPALNFPTASGRAQFYPRPHRLPEEVPDEQFPLVLNTGRVQHQWHTLTKTGKVAALNKLNPGPFIEVHPADASVLGLAEGAPVRLRSRRGEAVLPARISDRVLPGNCFAPFHWNDLHGDALCVNAVTSDAVDSASLQPELKVAAIALSRVEAAAAMNLTMPPAVDLLSAIDGLQADEALYLKGYLLGLASEPGRGQAGVPVLPASAPLAPARRLLFDGILAGVYSREQAVSAAAPAGPAHLVLWASQTGNAESFAARCASHLAEQGLAVRSLAMNEASMEALRSAASVVLVASTFGDGEAPDNAAHFWQQLQAATALEQLRYAVLAFGDSSYDQFCGFGRRLDERLKALGGTALAERVECEAHDLGPAQGWLVRIATALAGTPATPLAAPAAPASGALYSRQRPYKAALLSNTVLNGPGASKETRQVVFDLKGSGLTYQAGDALGVWPTNCLSLIEEVLACVGLDSSLPVKVPDQGDMPLAQALQRHFDITRITPQWLRFVAERSGAAPLQALLAADNHGQLAQWLHGRQLVDLLETFAVQMTAEELLGLLKPLQPRLYSISSSALAHPDHVHLTVSTLRYHCHERARSGLCSGFLADRAGAERVSIFVQRSAHFRVPANPATAMIMVGPGTGVAPFRAFLQERLAQAARGQHWLFFGEQHAASDFYYRDELLRWHAQGHLHHLDTAFSRDQAQKVYVQQRMLERGQALWQWLQAGAYFYVCGDAARMAKDVDAALHQVVRDHGGLDAEQASEYVRQMLRDKRYLRDVY